MKSIQTAIQEIAYYKWQAAGEPMGEDLRFWLEAERELGQRELGEDELVDESSEDSFPASDPPAGPVSTVGTAPRRVVNK